MFGLIYDFIIIALISVILFLAYKVWNYVYNIAR